MVQETNQTEIPHTMLSPSILKGIIEEFVTREGTDYGHSEFSLEEKVAQVKKQIERGEVKIIFDPVSETCILQRK